MREAWRSYVVAGTAVAVSAAVAAAVVASGCRSAGDAAPPPDAPRAATAAAPAPEPVAQGTAVDPLPDLPRLWDFDDLAASETRFRDAAAKARARGDRGYEVEALTQAARTLGLRKRYDEATAELAALQTMLRDDLPVASVRWNLEWGRTLNSSGHPAEAKPYFVAAFDLANRAGNVGLALDAAHMVAIVAPPDEALDWARKAMAVAEASSDRRARGWLGPLYNNTGWTLFERGDVDGALELWRKGVAVREGSADTVGLRIAWWTVARGLRAKGRHDEAIAILERIGREAEAAGTPDGFVHEEMAENLLALGRKDEAKPQFLRAWDLLKDDDEIRADAKRGERLRTAAGLAK